jgi:hypothetical protein
MRRFVSATVASYIIRALGFVGSLLFALPSYADSFTYVEFGAQASATGDLGNGGLVTEINQYTNQVVSNQDIETGGAFATNVWAVNYNNVFAFSYSQFNTVQVVEYAMYGQLGVSAISQSVVQASSVVYEGIVFNNPFESFGEGVGFVEYQDFITPDFSGYETYSINLNAMGSNSVTANNCSPNWRISDTLYGNGAQIGLGLLPCQSNQPTVASVTVPVLAGEKFSLNQQLEVIADSAADADSAIQDVGAEALDTSYLTITGVAYTSDSGTTYLTSFPPENVPEPNSIVMLGSGLALLGFIGFMRSRARVSHSTELS